ncbi:MAG: head GIN domain-containing protein [Nonlabens sp.]
MVRHFSAIKAMTTIVLLAILGGCDSENAPDCVQTAGEEVAISYSLPPFNKITIYDRVGLEITQGSEQLITLVTGQNLVNDIEIMVEDGRLLVVNNNTCNLTREYGKTVLKVTVPELVEIRSSTGNDIVSTNTITTPSLKLLSTDGPEEDFYHSNGDFILDLDVDVLEIETTNLSNFYLRGKATNSSLTWWSGDGILDASNLEIQEAQIFHRGTADWHLNVVTRLSGVINGYGNVYVRQRPATIDVLETWRGRLIIGN